MDRMYKYVIQKKKKLIFIYFVKDGWGRLFEKDSSNKSHIKQLVIITHFLKLLLC